MTLYNYDNDNKDMKYLSIRFRVRGSDSILITPISEYRRLQH